MPPVSPQALAFIIGWLALCVAAGSWFGFRAWRRRRRRRNLWKNYFND